MAERHWAQRLNAPPAPPVRPTVRRTYAGAEVSRLLADFDLATINAPDYEVGQNLRTLRARARELVRNSALAQRYVQLLEDNVIGPHGIRLQVQAEKADGTAYDKANQLVEDAWADWGEPETCTIDGRMGFDDLCRWLERTRAIDGEVFLRIVGAPSSPWGMALQQIDPDRVDDLYSSNLMPGGGFIRQGVECDEHGKPVAYYIWTAHPQDFNRPRVRERVEAASILHYYTPIRTGQTRGVPDFTSVMRVMKILDGYIEAEVVAARTGAAKMGWITQDPDKGAETPIEPQDQLVEAQAGQIGRLGPGEGFTPWDPSHPMVAFPDFTAAMLHWIAAGLGISYMTLTGDLSKASYSSGRIGLLAERDRWRTRQQQLITTILRPVYKAWLPIALLHPRLQVLAAIDERRLRKVQWQARGFPWADPLKEIETAKAEVAMGINTLTALAAERGRDFGEVIAQRAKEMAIAKAAGVDIEISTNPNLKESDVTNIDSEVPDGTKPKLSAVA